MSTDIYRHLDGIKRDSRGCFVESDGRLMSDERRQRYGLDRRVLQPGGMWWLRVEGKAVRR